VERVYLSRRNLEVLLSKLDRLGRGERTACAIVKCRNPDDPPEYAQSLDEVAVVAVPDESYYVSRAPGAMHPADEPNVGPRGAADAK
jgi:hypothetical protein